MFRENKKTSASCFVKKCPSKTIRTASIALYILSGQPNLKKKKTATQHFLQKKSGFFKKSSLYVMVFLIYIFFFYAYFYKFAFIFFIMTYKGNPNKTNKCTFPKPIETKTK